MAVCQAVTCLLRIFFTNLLQGPRAVDEGKQIDLLLAALHTPVVGPVNNNIAIGLDLEDFSFRGKRWMHVILPYDRQKQWAGSRLSDAFFIEVLFMSQITLFYGTPGRRFQIVNDALLAYYIARSIFFS